MSSRVPILAPESPSRVTPIQQAAARASEIDLIRRRVAIRSRLTERPQQIRSIHL